MKQLIVASLMILVTFVATSRIEFHPSPPVRAYEHGPSMLPGLTVDARSANTGSEGLARPECVAFRLGGNSRYECGDLQIQHNYVPIHAIACCTTASGISCAPSKRT